VQTQEQFPLDWAMTQMSLDSALLNLANWHQMQKAQRSAKGERIYHMPWQHDYARVKINASKGERWFCDEGEAERAGWRRAVR